MITLPYPPSANKYWRNVNGRMVKSKEARTYQAEAGWTAKAAGVRPTAGPLALTLRFYRPRRAGDLDNRLKVAIDSLNGVAYEDDAQVRELHAYLYDDKDNPRVEIHIEEVTE